MKTSLPIVLWLALSLTPISVRAQLVADGATNTLNNVTTNFTGDVTVGTNGSFTLLVLSDNALLTNTANGIIGRNATAISNEVQLLSPTARWQMGGSLSIGSNGALSRIVVGNGAFLNNNNGILGNRSPSSNNLAFVTGSGSFWSNRIDLTVGSLGPGNQLIISNGARVASRIGNLGAQPGSSNNLVVVTGPGSSWTNHLDVNVGVNERGNRLVIEDGGLVGGDNGRVGAGVGGTSEALVTGPGSLWSSRTDLAVGLNPANNRLVVSNGAAVVAGNNGRVGASVPATGNEVLVTGAGSLWSNQFELHVGEGSSGNRMEVNGGGRVVSSNTYVGTFTGTNLALVTGAGSLWSNRAGMYVGLGSSANQLVVTNSALVVNSNGYIGFNVPGSNNLAIITGAGTLWSNHNDFTVGEFSTGNQLKVNDGATMIVIGTTLVGKNPGANSNSIIVDGPGSSFTSSRDFILVGTNLLVPGFYVGSNSSFNRLTITNGGSVFSGLNSAVGGSPFTSGTNNEAIVTGTGSFWDAGDNLNVGDRVSHGNRVVITNGGRVQNGFGRIGSFLSTSNEVSVTGPGSSWSNSASLSLGGGGWSRLVISNSAVVNGGGNGVSMGLSASSTNNRVVVDGGTLIMSNQFNMGLLNIIRGTNVLNAGLIDAGTGLFLTNALGFFEFNSGTLRARATTVDNGRAFTVGNGGAVGANFNLAGNGSHTFANGLTVSLNSIVTGNGSIGGTLFLGGALAPGTPIGKIVLSNAPVLLFGSIMAMEISKNGAVLTNDQVQVISPLTYGNSLQVTKLGPTALEPGDRFQLFPAASYAGSFASITLPPLPSGFFWTNKLLVDGSIEVIAQPPLAFTFFPSAVTSNSATLNGLANPRFHEVMGWFEWGTTTNYGNVTPLQPLGSGSTDTNFSEALTGLASGVIYHYRAVVSNNLGIVTYGTDLGFSTRSPLSDLITYVKASNTKTGFAGTFPDNFGFAVAIAGDALVVGAPGENSDGVGVNGNQTNNNAPDSGAAYVFVRNGTSWAQQAYLKASNTGSNDAFGNIVAVDGDTIAVGGRFEDSSATGINGNGNDDSAPDAGAAYVFVRNGTNWTQQAYLKANNTDAGDVFGFSLALSGNTLVIGAQQEDSNATGINGNGSNNSATDSGAAYVFVRNGTNWTQQAYLKPSDTTAGDFFGVSVTISGDTIVVGARFEDTVATNSGAAYVFVRNGTNWTQQAKLKASNPGADDDFGRRTALSGNTAVVSASLEDSNATGVNGNQNDNSSTNSGAAYVFVRNGTTWTQQAYLKASNTGAGDTFGIGAVAIAGETLVVGANAEDSAATGMNGDETDNSAFDSGAAYLFGRQGTNWSQQAYLKPSNTDAADRFGVWVALSGNTVVVGGDGEDSVATGVNGNQSDNSAASAGAVYIFDLSPPVLNIAQNGISQVTLSWTPPTPGFALQESLSLAPANWSNSPSGPTNPISLPASGSTKFFRLFKP